MIQPEADDLTRHYWDGAKRGELLLQNCLDCRAVWHPPMPRCPSCHGERVEWRPSAGRGTVYSYIDVKHSVHPATDAWLPYRVFLVDLDEGPRLVSNCRKAIADSGLVPGARVKVWFEEIAPGVVLPQFALDPEAAP
jgi:uncharacterized OB-fold protein